MKFGTPLSEQAKAELAEAKGQVDEALAAVTKGLASTDANLQTRDVLTAAKNQLANAQSSLQWIRDSSSSGNDYYRKEAELGVHRVREAITNLKDVLRMLEVPE